MGFLLSIGIAFAQGGTGANGGGGHDGGTGSPAGGISITLPNPLACTGGGSNIECVLNKIINALLLFSAPIATIMILIGAFQILTAAGNPEKVTTGRNTILYAVLGFAIILLAKGIVLIITSIVTGP